MQANFTVLFTSIIPKKAADVDKLQINFILID